MDALHSRRTFSAGAWLFAAAFAFASFATAALAQEEDAAPAAAAPAGDAAAGTEAAPPSQSFLGWLIHTSGLIGLFLLLISLYFVQQVVQLFLELRPKAVIPPDFVADLEARLAERDYKGIYQRAKEGDNDYGRMVAAGMGSLASGLPEAREAIDREAEAVTVHMEKRISMLAVIGTLGPLIGLLGTLKGMIASFSVIAMSGTQLKAAEVAGGISEALVLTFEGVALSVPAIYFFAFFKNRVSALSVEAQNAADDFIRRVHASGQARPAAPARPTA